MRFAQAPDRHAAPAPDMTPEPMPYLTPDQTPGHMQEHRSTPAPNQTTARTLCVDPSPASFPSLRPAFFLQTVLTRRTPWPPEARLAPLNPDPGMLMDATGAPLPCVRLAYVLSSLPPDQGEALLRLALKTTTQVLAVDFKLAERNLELPAVLGARCLAGLATLCRKRREPRKAAGANAAHPDFLRHGGIEGLALRAGAVVLERRTLLGGAAALLRLAGNQGSARRTA